MNPTSKFDKYPIDPHTAVYPKVFCSSNICINQSVATEKVICGLERKFLLSSKPQQIKM